jgi:hypothetical protein
LRQTQNQLDIDIDRPRRQLATWYICGYTSFSLTEVNYFLFRQSIGLWRHKLAKSVNCTPKTKLKQYNIQQYNEKYYVNPSGFGPFKAFGVFSQNKQEERLKNSEKSLIVANNAKNSNKLFLIKH